MDGKAELLDEFNTYWSSKEMPVEWKLSIVVPVPNLGETPHGDRKY